MKHLNTWGHQTVFNYVGSVADGTAIAFGIGASIVGQTGHRVDISDKQYRDLIATFKGRTVPVGTSRAPAPGSLGEWLTINVGPTAVASYVAPILLKEGYADRVAGDDTLIRFR
jgi:hypothetical protein